MRPVRVTFELRMPMVVPTMDKPLDSVLSWAAVRQAERYGEAEPFLSQHDVGLGKHIVGDDWCFMASNMHIEWADEPTENLHYIRRQSLDQYVEPYGNGLFRKKPSIDLQRGKFSAGSVIQPTRWVKSVTAYAMVEDMERFEIVLNWVSHIGKLHHKDLGAVSSVKVVDDERARMLWIYRTLPAESPLRTNDHINGIGGLFSPYWDRAQHRNVAFFAGETANFCNETNKL